jgi:hypothetical protein
MPDCRNPHEWPLAYARLLCVNPKSGAALLTPPTGLCERQDSAAQL